MIDDERLRRSAWKGRVTFIWCPGMTTTFPTLPYLFQLSPNLSYPLPFLHQALSYTSPEKAARRLEIMKVKKAGKVIINKVYLEDVKIKSDKLQSKLSSLQSPGTHQTT